MHRCPLIALMTLAAVAPVAARISTPQGARIVRSAQFDRAASFIDSEHPRFVRDLITITEIAAPPFKEERRAAAYLEMLRAAGLQEVERDAEGNVMGLRKGTGTGPMLAVVAHLDSVFPEGTSVQVKRDGTRLTAPGVWDDARALAAMLAVIRAMNAAALQTPGDILFVGGVGEEGEGDLRGVKFLLGKGKYSGRIDRFLAIEGGEQGSIVRGAVGSRRYRVVFRGPGGHSYSAFGLVNPAYALAAAVARLADVQVPSTPKTTYNIGALKGGTSVNSIPHEVSMDADLRSESCGELAKLEEAFVGIVNRAAADENRARSTREGRIEAALDRIGTRPCGETPSGAPVVEAAAAVLREFGMEPTFRFSSTDSNVPMSLGIPALTINSGPGGRAHSLDEWTDVEPQGVARSIKVVLAVILAVAAG